MTQKSSTAAAWIAAGVFAVSTLWAVVCQLDWAITADSIYGKDATLHVHDSLKIGAVGFDPAGIVGYYRDNAQTSVHYPPAGFVLSSAVERTGLLDPLAAIYASHAFWIVLCALSLFGAGRRLGGGPWAGLAAAVVGTLNGWSMETARGLNLEYAAAAAVAFAFWVWSIDPQLTNPRRALAFGAACGLALLTKTATAVFIAPLALGVFALYSTAESRRPKALALRLGAAAAGVLAVVAWFYVPLLSLLLSRTASHARPDPAVFLANVLGYATDSLPLILPPLLWLIAACAALLLAVRRERFVLLAVFVAGVGLVGISLFVGRMYSYLYPIQIAAALVVAAGLGRIPKAARVIVALALAIVYVGPTALDSQTTRQWEDADSPVLDAVYVPYGTYISADNWGASWPRRRVIAPRKRTDIAWEGVQIARRLLETRYAGYGYDDLAVLDVDTYAGAAPGDELGTVGAFGRFHTILAAATALAYPADAAAGSIYNGPERFRQYSLLPVPPSPEALGPDRRLVVALVPDPPEIRDQPHLRALRADLKRLTAGYRLDTVYRYEWVPGISASIVWYVHAPPDGPPVVVRESNPRVPRRPTR